MPTAVVDGIPTRYEVTGDGPPLLMFSPGGFDSTLESWRTVGIYRRLNLLEHLLIIDQGRILQVQHREVDADAHVHPLGAPVLQVGACLLQHESRHDPDEAGVLGQGDVGVRFDHPHLGVGRILEGAVVGAVLGQIFERQRGDRIAEDQIAGGVAVAAAADTRGVDLVARQARPGDHALRPSIRSSESEVW